ncbi:ComF family protein, partial [Campylobacter jejuni]|nr:ComF family protein [Campylobacter jejuni]
MRCINCGAFALLCFCDLCELELSEFSLNVRKLDNNFKVYSFYKYHEIQ